MNENYTEFMDQLLIETMKQNATDLHLCVGTKPLMRVNSKLVAVENTEIIKPEAMRQIVHMYLNDLQMQRLQENKTVDMSYSKRDLGRFRCNFYLQRGTYALAIRSLPLDIPDLQALGLPDVAETFLEKTKGLVLITGSTGSGKSTTLASMIKMINERHRYHITTIEDPVEYLHRHNKSMVTQKEIGGDALSFSGALKSALREDPDVIMLGEMRDMDTISIALTAAETGHLVLSTLHTNGAVKAIDRILDAFPTEQQNQVKSQLATVLEGVVSQQLVPKVDKTGLVLASEVMVVTPAVRNLIRDGKHYQINNLIQNGMSHGMRSLERNLAKLCQDGIISETEGHLRSGDIQLFNTYLNQNFQGGIILANKVIKLPKEELIIFTRQLGLIIDSDVSLFEGLVMIRDKSDHVGIKEVIEGMLSDLQMGKSLGDAIKAWEGSFPTFIINMIDIGEKSGDLTSTLNQVADAYEREIEATNKVKSAVTYPIILSVLMFGVILLLILQVLPMFNEILESLGGEMPALTKSIIAISLFIGKYIWVFLIIVVLFIAFYFYYKKTDKGQAYFDQLKFRLPVIKDINASLAAVRFSRNLAVLIRSGISMSIGMEMIEPIMNNSYVEKRMQEARKALNQGSSADKVIESLDLFPWVLVKLFSVAQTTGHMDTMLDKAADVMEKETDARLERLTTVIEPVLIIILSAIIGVILISVILPIISIMNSIGQVGDEMRKYPNRLNILSQIIALPFIAIVLLLLISEVADYDETNSSLNKTSVQETVEKYAIQCYASEGSYPPDLNYLVDNYGLILDEERFIYEYDIFASNIMPDIIIHDVLPSKPTQQKGTLMMKRRIHVSVESLMVILLMIMFAVAISVLIYEGSVTYRNIITNKNNEENTRIAMSYINMRIKQNDILDRVTVDENAFEGEDVLTIWHHDAEEGLVSYIYLKDGILWECYTDGPLDHALSTEIIPLNDLSFETKNDGQLIYTTIQYKDGDSVIPLTQLSTLRTESPQ